MGPRDPNPRLIIAYVLTCRMIGKSDYSIDELVKADLKVSDDDVVSVCNAIQHYAEEFEAEQGREKTRGVVKLLRNMAFLSYLLNALLSENVVKDS